MRTSDVMNRPVVTVGLDAQLKDVAAILVEHGINAVPVVDDGDRLVGIVSEADLLTLEPSAGTWHRPTSPVSRPRPRTARHVMSQSVYTVDESTDVAAAARILLRHNLKSVPVVAGGRVVGMVARRDLLRLVARGDQDIRADLEHRLKDELDALQGLSIDVTAGVVTIDGAAGPLGRQLLEGLAHTVAGVVEVHPSPPAPDGVERTEV
ncbi:MAG TPA: CBS domain-containing protein [Actinomycetes bacterium]|nr:CBS domain-containing protein [Actinomycetes bacterium]